MQVKWERVSDATAGRFSQLTNKSNQFNLRTQRYSDAEIDEMRKSNQYALFTVSLMDKFSNYGVIACIVLRFKEESCIIENWVMSCRVLKKTVENYTACKVAETARQKGLKNIRSEYLASKKNGMVSCLYEDLGFDKTEEVGDAKRYILDEEGLQGYKQKYIMKEIL
jgi:FkbH-like protein